MNGLIKKIIALVSVTAIAFSSSMVVGAVPYFQYGDYTIGDLGDNTLEIHTYDGTDANVVLPDMLLDSYISSIDNYAFLSNSALETIDLSGASKLNHIGQNAFYGCSALKSVEIPDTVTEIKNGVFFDCPSLSSVTYSNSLNTIPLQMFCNCSSLAEFDVPESVITIDRYAFMNCTSLSKIVIPKSVSFIGEYAFYNTPNLVIYCYRDSYAQEYAQANNISYEFIDKYPLGDVTRDGALNIEDATRIQKYLAQIVDFDEEELALADFDKDGAILIKDVTAIQRYLADIA